MYGGDIQEFDEVLITGQASSPIHYFENLRCVVATVSKDGWIKVWPLEGQPDPNGSGKIWFDLKEIREIKLIERGLEDAES